MSAAPRVSVCIPAYNMGRFLKRAIDSVLSQNLEGVELTVCDDSSKDDTPEICRSYGGALRYLRAEPNLGQAGNFNRCLAEGRADLVAILHADDYYLPGFLADRVAAFAERPDASMVFGAIQVVDAEDRPLHVSGRWQEDRRLERTELLEALLLGCAVCPSATMFRREAAARTGPFRADLTWGHDWEWALRLAETGGGTFHARPLVAYRVHDGSGTSELLNAAKNGAQERRILDEALARLEKAEPRFAAMRGPTLQALGLRHMSYAEGALLNGRPAVARYNLSCAASADPWLALRPTAWALWLASWTGRAVYDGFRKLRGPVSEAPRAV